MNSFIFPFEKLDVRRTAVDHVDRVFSLIERLPAHRHLRLVSQLEGAVTSISQNIARRRKLFHEEDCKESRGRCEMIDGKINGLRNSLRGVSNVRPPTSNLGPPT